MRHKTTSEEASKILELYKNGLSVAKISKEMNLSNGSVYRSLKRNQVELRSLSASNSIHDRDGLFLNLNSREVHYWLGFLCADGNICASSNTITINLAKKDEDHLKLFKDYTSSNWLRIEKTNSVRAYFSNKIVKERLISYGITPNKTFTLKLSIPISWELLLGVFDGDGTIDKSKNGTFKVFTASRDFAMQISKFLVNNDVIVSTTKNHTLYTISVRDLESKRKIYNSFYYGSIPFLSRKMEIFGSVI